MAGFPAHLIPPGKEHEWPYNGLTLKQEIFATAIACGYTGHEAWFTAYNTPRHKVNAASVAASRQRRHPKIAARLNAFAEHGVMKVTLQEHLAKLAELRDGAQSEGKFGDAIKAEVARGKASGLYIERTEVSHKTDVQDFTLEELDARIAELQDGTGAIVGEEEEADGEVGSGRLLGVHDGVSSGPAPRFDLQEAGGCGERED